MRWGRSQPHLRVPAVDAGMEVYPSPHPCPLGPVLLLAGGEELGWDLWTSPTATPKLSLGFSAGQILLENLGLLHHFVS